MKNFMHRSSIQFKTVLTVILLILVSGLRLTAQPTSKLKKDSDKNIMLALLLDTSNSMDGLIDQAKSQLWKIVNELSSATCRDGSRPNIKIALYEYGNDNLSAEGGYIRQVSPFTTDLDLISERLFGLRTNGGEEYCGAVIQKALTRLEWSAGKADLKLIFIAGNEPFTQGGVSYRLACSLAKEKDVVVNTIFCGDFDEGMRTSWKNGADLTGGTYMSIEQNRKTVYVSTPYDDRIDACNERLNKTYIYYGSKGRYKKDQQSVQDENAGSFGQSNKVERAVSKSSHAYNNSSWDLVDATEKDKEAIVRAKEDELPDEMKGMSIEERKAYVTAKAEERQSIQNEIQSLNKKRMEYIATHTPTESTDAMLDAAMIKAIKEQAMLKDFRWN